MDTQLRSIKLVYDNGIIQDVSAGIVILKNVTNMEYEAVNVLPHEQLLITAITLHQLYSEFTKDILSYEDDHEEEDYFEKTLVDFIKQLLEANKKVDKGEVLQ